MARSLTLPTFQVAEDFTLSTATASFNLQFTAPLLAAEHFRLLALRCGTACHRRSRRHRLCQPSALDSRRFSASKMTYIVLGGALNSIHSLTHSLETFLFTEWFLYIQRIHLTSTLRLSTEIYWVCQSPLCLQWHTCLFCVEYSLRLSEVCTIFWNCGLTAMKSTPFLLYVYWTFCRRFGHILWWNFCVSVRFTTHILHCCLIELV